MDALLRAVFIYVFLLVVLRVSGKRTLSQITAFDFVLLLVIGQAVQQGLMSRDFSLTNAVVVVVTLLTLDVLFSLIKHRSRAAEMWGDGAPLVIFAHGRLIEDRSAKERVDQDDILQAARSAHGLTSIDQIEYAVLEKGGGITVIPKANAETSSEGEP